MTRTTFFSITCLILMAYVCSCRPDAKRPSSFPDVLIDLPNASKVKFAQSGGTDQLSYFLEAEYPATDVIDSISEKLAERGWKVLNEDWLNPGEQSSHTEGWSHFEDVSKKPNTIVFQWLAQWQDDGGNIVVYSFQYRDPTDYTRHQMRPDSRSLTVSAVYVPTEVAKDMMKWATTANREVP